MSLKGTHEYRGVSKPFDKNNEGGCLPGNGIWSDLRANI
jgi:hypothetical protein